jgi:hypothetical protein
MNKEGQTTITLDFPFTPANGSELKTLSLRRPKVRDLRRMKDYGKDEIAQEIGLLAQLAGLTPEDLDDMDGVDYGKLQDAFRAFRGG